MCIRDSPYTVAGTLAAREIREWNPVINIFA